MPLWLIKLFQSAGRKEAAKAMSKREGITQIPNIITAEDKAAELWTTLRNAGLKEEDMAKYISSEKDIIRLVNKVESMQKQQKTKVISRGDPEFQGITDKLLNKKAKVYSFQGFNPRVQQDVDGIIKNLKSMKPMDAMKEANLIIGRKGKYKNLSGDEAQRILKDTDDHIFQRDIQYDEFGDPIKPDPEDMASGGRIGYAEGKSYEAWLNYRISEIAKGRLPVPFKEWQKGEIKMASGGRIGFHEGSLRHQKEHDYQSLEEEGNVMKHLMLSGDRAKMSSPENWVDRLLGKKDWKYNQKRDDFETMMKERFMYGKRKTPNVFQGTWKEFQDMYENFIKSKMATGAGGIAGQLHLNEGGRAGFPFGGPVKGKKALKAIMDAFRSNKHWGVGGPPYDPVATSFDVKKITERIYGAPLSLADIRKGAKHPQMSGINKFDFPAFNKKWKEVKANVLKEKLEESQRWATSQIKAAKEVPAEDATGKKVKAQFLREGEKKLKEANEGLKEIEIYINMLQKKGRKLHAAGGIARAGYFLGDLVKEKIPAEYRLYAKSILPGGESGKVGSDYFTEDFKQELRKQALDKYNMTGKVRGTVGESFQHRGDPTVNELIGFPSTYASLGTYTYDVDPKTLDVKITDRYDWNPAYGKQKIADTESVGWIGDKKGKDVDLTMLKDYVVNAVKNKEIDKASALELIGNYFGGKASEGKGFDVDIDIPTREATLATEGSFASGGIARVGFDKGGMSRRGFLKTMAGLASIPLIGKYFKWAKPASKIAATVEKTGAGTGMPVWFPKFVDKVLKEGTDATGAYATAERQIVKKINLPESNTEVLVTHDLVSGDTMVDVGLSKHGFGAGRHGQPAQLYLSKGEEISPDIIAPGMRDAKGLKTKDEFWVDEAEFTGGHPENVKFEDSIQFNYGEHGSDFSELEKFATGKNVDKKIIGKQADKDAWAQGHAESRAEQMAEEGLDEFAQGGRASYTKGGLAKILGV